MSSISGYGDNAGYYDQGETELPPGSDNPVENAGDNPPVEEQEAQPGGDSSAADYVEGVLENIDDNITAGNYERPNLTGPLIVYNGGDD